MREIRKIIRRESPLTDNKCRAPTWSRHLHQAKIAMCPLPLWCRRRRRVLRVIRVVDRCGGRGIWLATPVEPDKLGGVLGRADGGNQRFQAHTRQDQIKQRNDRPNDDHDQQVNNPGTARCDKLRERQAKSAFKVPLQLNQYLDSLVPRQRCTHPYSWADAIRENRCRELNKS